MEFRPSAYALELYQRHTIVTNITLFSFLCLEADGRQMKGGPTQ
jgi:hypothetical protein